VLATVQCSKRRRRRSLPGPVLTAAKSRKFVMVRFEFVSGGRICTVWQPSSHSEGSGVTDWLRLVHGSSRVGQLKDQTARDECLQLTIDLTKPPSSLIMGGALLPSGRRTRF
jgi:hypothetical protein